VKKPEEELVENGKAADPNNWSHWRVKARWYLSKKASSGQLQSPTLSQMGRTVLFQLMATFRWRLGDVKGFFDAIGPCMVACLPAAFLALMKTV